MQIIRVSSCYVFLGWLEAVVLGAEEARKVDPRAPRFLVLK